MNTVSSLSDLLHSCCPVCGSQGYKHLSRPMKSTVAPIQLVCPQDHTYLVQPVEPKLEGFTPTEWMDTAKELAQKLTQERRHRTISAPTVPDPPNPAVPGIRELIENAVDPTRLWAFHHVRTGRTSSRGFHVVVTPEEYEIIEAHRRQPTDHAKITGLRPEDIDPTHPRYREGPVCNCNTCWRARPRAHPFMDDRGMHVCPECGNKRCPKATLHSNDCTNSNAPGQKGSDWEDTLPLGPQPLPSEPVAPGTQSPTQL